MTILWRSEKRSGGARLIVGLGHRGELTEATLDELIESFYSARIAQNRSPDATITPTVGLYTYPDGAVEREGSAVITVLNLAGEPLATFEAHMVKAAAAIARDLDQFEVIVELFDGGRVYQTLGVGPDISERTGHGHSHVAA